MIYAGHISAAIADLAAAVAAAGDLEAARPQVLAPISTSTRALVDECDVGIAALDAEIVALAPLIAEGGMGPDMATALTAIHADIGQSLDLHSARGLAGRVRVALDLVGAP